MADSKHNRRNGDWSIVGDDAVGEIVVRMDTTSAVRLAACSKELHRQVKEAKGRCPNDGCGTLLAYRQFHSHKIACPHGPCNCIEPGCVFAGPPAALLVHLKEAHSRRVRRFHYGKIHRYIARPMPAPGSRSVDIIGSGDDGTVFAVRFDTREKLQYCLSVVCVRSPACLSPRYIVKLWMPVARTVWGVMKYSGHCVPETTASPDGIPYEELEWYLPVRPSQTMAYCLRIDRVQE